MLQQRVVVTAVKSYTSEDLGRCVRSLLQFDPELTAWLRGAEDGRHVVVKPNWIQESHELDPAVWEPVITHPAVVFAVVEGLAELMSGRGTISVCDAPHTYARFEEILRRGNLLGTLAIIKSRFPALTLEVLDLRREIWVCKDQVIVERRGNPPDPRGYVSLNLSRESMLFGHGGEGRYYGADYDAGIVNAHHAGERQEYLLAGTPVRCDLFVNLPKLKTHKKTGITGCLKNLVGINGDKNWLPHHTEGAPGSGGDEFPARTLGTLLEGSVKRLGRRVALAVPGVGTWLYRRARNAGKGLLGDSESVVRNGNWSGNDTCWRMALDLNRALLYGNPDGTWREKDHPRRYLAIVDGIIGGEGNGPLCPEPVASGVLLAGTNAAAVDAVACQLMGFDPRELPIVSQAFASHRWPLSACELAQVEVMDDRAGQTLRLADVPPAVASGFRPHFGWAGLRPVIR